MFNPFKFLISLIKVHYIGAKSFTMHGCNQMAAALAFYGIFSLAPLIAISIAVAGVFIEPGAIENLIDTELYKLLGENADNYLRMI